MAKTIFSGKHILLRHTLEEEGPHLTQTDDHYEDTLVIMALLRGTGTCFLGGTVYQLSPGDLTTIGTEEIHSYHFLQNGPHERLSIYFSSSVLSPFWEYELPLMRVFTGHQPGTGNHYSRAVYAGTEVEGILAELCRMADTVSEKHTPVEEAKVHLLVLRLLFSLYDCFEKRSLSPSASVQNAPLVSEICRHIRTHPEADLSYHEIQRKFFVSRYYLSAVFRQNTGMTLTEYVLQTRMMRVSTLVRQGWGLVDAAEAAGFRSYSHFYKEFVKRKNISPRIYYSKGLENR